MGSGLSEHLESRRHVESALVSTGVPVTVLRAAMIIGSGSFEIMCCLVQRLPVTITRPGSARAVNRFAAMVATAAQPTLWAWIQSALEMLTK